MGKQNEEHDVIEYSYRYRCQPYSWCPDGIITDNLHWTPDIKKAYKRMLEQKTRMYDDSQSDVHSLELIQRVVHYGPVTVVPKEEYK